MILDDDAIRRLIYEDYESRNKDYKRSIPWSHNTKYGLIKDIAAFANSGGGYLVIGYDESLNSQEERLTGITEEHIATWEVTKVCNDINNYLSPPIDVDLIPYREPTGTRKFLIVMIPQHLSMPHICIRQKNDNSGNLILRKSAIYIRTKNKSCEEIADASEMQELIRRCLLKDKEALLKQIEEIVRGSSSKLGEIQKDPANIFIDMDGFKNSSNEFKPANTDEFVTREVICRPESPTPSVRIENAEEALQGACYDYRGWPFVFYLPNSKVPPGYQDDIIWACNDRPFYELIKFDYWAFNYRKSTFYARNFTHESSMGQKKKFDPIQQVSIIAEIIISQGRLFSNLGLPLDIEMHFGIKYSPMKGVQVAWLESFRFIPGNPYSGDSITDTLSVPLSEMLNSAPRIASGLVMNLIRRMGVKMPSLEGHLVDLAEKHLSKGQKPVY